MTDIEPILQRLGLSEYCAVFVAEGFDTWETVLDVQENDLYALLPLVKLDGTDAVSGNLSMSN